MAHKRYYTDKPLIEICIKSCNYNFYNLITDKLQTKQLQKRSQCNCERLKLMSLCQGVIIRNDNI